MSDIKNTNYDLLQKQLISLIEDESNLIAILSNTSALLNDHLDQVNWVGFYLIENNELILGPFQGHPACVHIQIGKGVCGTAVSNNETQVVKDVHQFPDTLPAMQIVILKLSFQYIRTIKLLVF